MVSAVKQKYILIYLNVTAFIYVRSYCLPISLSHRLSSCLFCSFHVFAFVLKTLKVVFIFFYLFFISCLALLTASIGPLCLASPFIAASLAFFFVFLMPFSYAFPSLFFGGWNILIRYFLFYMANRNCDDVNVNGKWNRFGCKAQEVKSVFGRKK